ncbi:hypothetical protein ACK323_13235 [Aeromonas enteropelogenes]|uniref:hypothetical protein n=1 Tax=Aeromonas enteropelogenes TaxID=29489 RepID=UPI0038D1074C
MASLPTGGSLFNPTPGLPGVVLSGNQHNISPLKSKTGQEISTHQTTGIFHHSTE